MVCFESTVQSSFHTFLVLIAYAAEVERGQQNSASEKPRAEFEHSPEGNQGKRRSQANQTQACQRLGQTSVGVRYKSLDTGPECCTYGRGKSQNRSPAAASRFL